ncbi:helix-turn-helix domain-containing protein [Serratia fonticola]|uniref:helix-turn-helix domain-containing protein n=1 Tax=Serratia fonticola TaxID=47917 RepID=UPI00217BB40B|nr:helix-turn-helix domain-containing protein [Serratia fonticola]CAI0828444.1 Response regulator ArlR [Serratia fonticola]
MLKIELNGNLLTANDGIKIRLTKKEEELLFYFIEKKSECISHAVLIYELWHSHSDFKDNLSQLVFNLRKKLNCIGMLCIIESVRGIGYIFDKDKLFSIKKTKSKSYILHCQYTSPETIDFLSAIEIVNNLLMMIKPIYLNQKKLRQFCVMSQFPLRKLAMRC